MPTHEPTTILRLGPDDHGRLVSADEYAEEDFQEPFRYERSEGRLIVRAPASEEHDDLADFWRDELIVYNRFTRPGVVQKIRAIGWVRPDEGSDRLPDIVVYLAPVGPVPKTPDRVPDIVFEVVSRSAEVRRREYIHKRRDYHRLGIAEHVVIDHFEAQVTVFTHQPDGYAEQVLTASDTYDSPRLPGFAVPLAGMFPP